jgi:hypothetical protein
MNRTGDHHVEQDKPSSKNQILHAFVHLWTLDQGGLDLMITVIIVG